MTPLAGHSRWNFWRFILENFEFLENLLKDFGGKPDFWCRFIFWRPWTFRGCSLFTHVGPLTLVGLFELRGCAFLSYSDFCCLLRARGGVLDFRALSKVMLRVPLRAVLFCFPLSIASHIFDI